MISRLAVILADVIADFVSEEKAGKSDGIVINHDRQGNWLSFGSYRALR